MDQANPLIKFSGENWTTWRFQMQIVLKAKGLYEIVTGTVSRPSSDADEWDKKDAKAQEVIVVRMEEKPLTHVLSCNTSAEMWDKLITIYEHKSQVSVHLLQQKFFNLKYEEGGIAEFVSQIEEIQGHLNQMGEKISDKMAITKILMSLPDSLRHFVSAWESTPSDKQTLNELMSRLMIEEDRTRQSEQTTALATRSDVKRQQKKVKCFECDKVGHVKKNCPQLKLKNKKSCHYCKKQGHLIQDCWYRKKKNESEKNSNNVASTSSSTQALVGVSSLLNYADMSRLIGQSKTTKSDWWLDSGATEHMLQR